MNYKRIIILVVVLGVLTAGYFLVKNLDDEVVEQATPTPVPVETINILQYADEELNGFTVKYPDGMEFIFKSKQVTETVETTDDDETTTKEEIKTVWYIENHKDLKIVDSALDSIVGTIMNLDANEIIDEQADDVEQFGLETDYITVNVYGKEDNTLKIGSKTLTNSGYYVMKDGDSKVYLANSYDIEKLAVTRLSLQDKQVNSFDYTTVQNIMFKRDGEKVFDAYKQDEFVFQLTYPLDVPADYADVEKMLMALSQLTAIEYVDENSEDLAQYGLSQPLYEFVFTTNENKEYGIQLGKDAGSATIYAKVNETGFIFKTSTEPLGFLDKPIEDIIDGFIHGASIWEVEEVRVTMEGRTDISKINVVQDEETNATTTEEYTFNGYKFDNSNEELVSLFKKYYQGIIGITVNQVDTKAVPDGSTEIIIEYIYKDKSRNTKIELVPAEDEINYYVIRDGKYAGIKTLKRDLEKRSDSLKPAYENFVKQLPE